MKNSDLINLLGSLPLFLGMAEEKLVAVLDESARIFSFSAGQEIASPANREKKLGILLDGTASVFSSDENNGALLRILGKGDSFGVSTLFSTQERFVSLIVAKKACRVLFLDASTVASLLRTDERFCMNYIRFLSDRICFLNTKISCFTAGSPERRLAFFLLAFGEEEASSYSVSLHANSLSDMLNVGRASLYRAFDKLAADGLIKKEGKQITVLDKNTLKERFG